MSITATSFHRMMLFVERRGNDEHWVPDSMVPTVVEDPFVQGAKPLLLRFAIYSAFRGEIPVDRFPAAICDREGCVKPEHQELIESDVVRSEPMDLSPAMARYKTLFRRVSRARG